MSDFHGLPCWYELSTADTTAAQAFYRDLLGWNWANANMPGMDYFLASRDKTMIAGMMKGEAGGPPPMWTVYFAVDDCDASVAAMSADGARAIVPPTDVPGTGRFSILADPQGAAFGILKPLPMEAGSTAGGAFDQLKSGHGNWHELMTSDPAAAMRFYARHLGWTASRSMDMGAMGSYDLFARGGTDIGGIMRQPPNVPRPAWMPYFGTAGADSAAERIKAGGGKVVHGPAEVPGGAFIVAAVDPQGAMVAVVGPKG